MPRAFTFFLLFLHSACLPAQSGPATPDECWDNDALHRYFDNLLRGSDIEAVDARLMLIDPDSAAARRP